jgi:subtilase family protein
VDTTDDRNALYRAEILVALEHARTVSARLAALGIPVSDRQDSEALGLTRLRLPEDGVAPAAGRVDDALPAERPDPPRRPASDLDRLLWGLRALFAAEYAGWTPTLGKNRLVGNVQGGGRISHGSGTDPRVARPPASSQLAGPQQGREPAALRATVGVVDTAVSSGTSLAGAWVGSGADVLPERSGYPAVAGHGTFVTGLVRSVAPGCVVKVAQVLSPDTGEADAWTVAQRIVALGRTGLDVLNLSMVCYTEDGQPPLVLASAVDRLDPDIVVVAAAGNHGEFGQPGSPERREPAWPAALDDVVAVGAAHHDGTRAALTPQNAPWIDVCAPGMDVLSTYLSGTVALNLSGGASTTQDFSGWARWDGSSFAAALVSGAIAARTVPGRVPAQQAWRELLCTAEASEDGGPPFLRLPGR